MYASALVFSPKMTIIRREFLSQGPIRIKTWPNVDENWSPSLLMLEGHSGPIYAVTFRWTDSVLRWLQKTIQSGFGMLRQELYKRRLKATLAKLAQ